MKPMLSFPREGEALDRKPPKESALPQTHVNSKTKMKHTSRPGCTKWTTKNCHIMGTTQEKQVEKDDIIVGTVTLEVYLICKAWNIMKMRLTAKPHKVFQRLASNESNIAKENNHVKFLVIRSDDLSQNGKKCAAPKSWRAPWSHRWNDLRHCEHFTTCTTCTAWTISYFMSISYFFTSKPKASLVRADVAKFWQAIFDLWPSPPAIRKPAETKWLAAIWLLYVSIIVWKFYIQHSTHSTMNMINV